MHNKMPTDENIRRRGCTVVLICVLCMSNFETSEHLILSCPFAAGLWTWLGDQLHCSIDTTSVISTLSCVPSRGSSQVRDIFISGIVHTVHTVWLVRNCMCFNASKVSVLAAKAKILTMISMFG